MSGSTLAHYHDLEEAYEERELWRFFTIAEDHFNTSYNDYLNDRFSPEQMQSIQIPKVYERIWGMKRVRQILTLNIDGLCQRAFHARKKSSTSELFEYTGMNAIDSQDFIARNLHTLVHLHGVYSQRSTWVMSDSGRGRLFDGIRGESYRSLLRSIFTQYNIVFLGVNPRDVALSPVLEEIAKLGLFSSTYWITPNVSQDNYSWAEANRVRVINYTPDQSGTLASHSSTICQILDDVDNSVSRDVRVSLPARGSEQSPRQIAEPLSLLPRAASEAEEVRSILADGIEYLLRENDLEYETTQMQAFLKKYDPVFQATSIVGKLSGINRIGNYELIDEISTGPSTVVWLAREVAKDGRAQNIDLQDYVVLKLLTASAFRDETLRQGFRRGIESLYYLSDQNQPVAPRYITHFDVPLAVVMEHVAGSNLDEVIDVLGRGLIDRLKVFLNIARAVLSCHTSPGRVLHRDIKPKNVIVRGVYAGCDPDELLSAQVSMINFELSWHRFSKGSTKSVQADEIGYYAPEQRALQNSDSPRYAFTDTYMLGMLCYFMLTDEAPPEGGSLIGDWQRRVESKLRSREDSLVAANRVSRTILRMTAPNPDDRGDLTEAIAELEATMPLLTGKVDEVDPDIFLEWILSECGFDYRWDVVSAEGEVVTSRNINLRLKYVSRGQRVQIFFTRSRGDASERKGFGGRLAEIVTEVIERLRRQGWRSNSGGGVIRSLSLEADIKELRRDPTLCASEIKWTVGRLMSGLD
jgi:serine/threonine protein kinase